MKINILVRMKGMMNIIKSFLLLMMIIIVHPTKAQDPTVFTEDFNLTSKDSELFLIAQNADTLARSMLINKEEVVLNFDNGQTRLDLGEISEAGSLFYLENEGQKKLYHVSKSAESEYRVRKIPLWLSILPPLIAIMLALIFKEVIMSLFIGVFTGAFIAGGLRIESFYYFLLSFFNTINKYLIETMSDSDHLSVILFSLFIGGMVAIISKNGGMAGVVLKLSKYAKTPASAQFITWLIGVAIFFDDYANTLIVGNTMRNITDRFRISREKLAYIVDSTAAPVAAIAFITTWIGAELGYIADGIKYLEGFDPTLTPYAIFLSSLKYTYYPLLTLIFILLIIFLKRDFGPMYNAEVRARSTGKVTSAIKGVDDEPDMEDLSPVEGIKYRWYNAALPVSLVILVTFFGLLTTGFENSFDQIRSIQPDFVENSWGSIWQNLTLIGSGEQSILVKLGTVIGNSNSFTALIWGSLSGLVVAILLTVSQRIANLHNTMFFLMTGFKTMLPALMILCLAWSLAITTKELHTAVFITSALDGSVNPHFMPMIIFILSALIAFSTGSSWSTMAIVFPIAIPASWTISIAYGMDAYASSEILFNVIAGILGASVLGDHVSPISDTTILSSLASDCNHIDHVRTQIPYALTVGLISIISITITAFWKGGFLANTFILLIDIGILFPSDKVFWKEIAGC